MFIDANAWFRFDSSLMVINHNPLDKDYKNLLSNPLDGNLSNAFCYPSFDITTIIPWE